MIKGKHWVATRRSNHECLFARLHCTTHFHVHMGPSETAPAFGPRTRASAMASKDGIWLACTGHAMRGSLDWTLCPVHTTICAACSIRHAYMHAGSRGAQYAVRRHQGHSTQSLSPLLSSSTCNAQLGQRQAGPHANCTACVLSLSHSANCTASYLSPKPFATEERQAGSHHR